MKIVRMLHPFCIPVFGYIAGGDEIGMPDNIADAMVMARYAEYWDAAPPVKVSELPPAETTGPSEPIRLEIEWPIEVSMESRKSKRTKSPVAEDAPAEEN